MKNIVIGGAWPYANGSLHIGHLAALLPGDVLARYYRAKGCRVFYVSGSDCFGTPITLRAAAEGRKPLEISDEYHREFTETFQKLGFSYDLYTRTSGEAHQSFVREFHRKMYEGQYVAERDISQVRCPVCQKVLTDRMVIGRCPKCGSEARGDQCEACGTILDTDTLLEPRCAVCGSEVEIGETRQLFLLLSQLQDALEQYLAAHPYWRRNAAAFTARYLEEGLRDRAITRDLTWGIRVPYPGYEEKRIYIWAENVLGYLSAVHSLCEKDGIPFQEIYGRDADTRTYYIHGKDNIPFHTIILPALLIAHGGEYRLPDDIISSEYVTLEGRKISTSRNWAVWAKELADSCDPDAVRYFFLAYGPEKKDADFSKAAFQSTVNGELVGVWGNFVNRTLAFAEKYLDHELPRLPICQELLDLVAETYNTAGRQLENGQIRDAVQTIFELIRFGNRWYDAAQPWRTRSADPAKCRETISDCVYLVENLSVLLQPVLPFSSEKVIKWLGLTADWRPQRGMNQLLPQDYSILFRRMEQ